MRGSGVFSTCTQRCWSVLAGATGSRSTETKYQVLFEAMAGSQRYLSSAEFAEGLHFIAAKMNVRLSEVDSTRILEIVREETVSSDNSGESSSSSVAVASSFAALTKEEISAMKVGELKDMLVSAGLNTDGLKKALVERLITARDTALALQLASRSSMADNYEQPDSTILVLDHRLQEFPWEGLDVMESCNSVTRMPSLEVILKTASTFCARSEPLSGSSAVQPSIRQDRISFLLNAAGDLKATERQLAPIFDIGRETFGWQGSVGRVPEEGEMRCDACWC